MVEDSNQSSLKGKKIVYINLGNYGSTGRIIYDISSLATEEGASTIRCFPEEKLNNEQTQNDLLISNNIYLKINRKLAVYSGLNGRFNIIASFRLIKYFERIKPDLVHLHNLHNSYINLTILFNYLRKKQINIIWTLHDCWAFTGHCAHYSMNNCDKWLSGCKKCNYYREYPYGLFDNAHNVYKYKKRIFSGIKNMTITTPSYWLSTQVKKSFLGDYRIQVISNGIDSKVFCPKEQRFACNYDINDKKIILGVSFDWTLKKGIDVFIKLSEMLPEQYQIVLVGQCNEFEIPSNIIHIERTENREELAEIYSAAYVFVNPTREEVFGLVNAEALACGTPVITFDTGGCPEVVDDTCGLVCRSNDCQGILECLEVLNSNYPEKKACRSRGQMFDYRKKYIEYIELYKDIFQKCK